MSKLVCQDCNHVAAVDQAQFQCHCGGLYECVHDFKQVDAEKLKAHFDERLSERLTPYASGVWRYKELIFPDLPPEFVTTKYEGNTGLYLSEPLARYAGIRKLWMKAQSENPSGSFKDNGMTVALSHGRSLGYSRFACSSTGNTSSSLAMYAALAGLEAFVFVPKQNISLNKVLQTLAYGAHLIEMDGTYDDDIRFLQKHAKPLGLYVCNSVNPFRIEGQKSIIFEIAQMLSWTLPDWVIVPGGALSNASALGKGLHDLYTLGFISKLPRVAIVQADGANPFYRMVHEQRTQLTPQDKPYTVASALNIGNPPSWKKASGTLQLTNGVTVSVSDDQILAAKAVIDRSGIGCEPASAATLAGLQKLVAQQVIDKEETAVCILTGHLLKDTDILNHTTRQTAAAAVSLDTFMKQYVK
ncbi:MAG: threonine synthase [Clostridia bacterium]